MWETGLAVYDDMKGIAWKWQALDGSNTKAPIGNEAVGKSPVDRGKKWNKKTFIGGRRLCQQILCLRIFNNSIFLINLPLKPLKKHVVNLC